MLTKQYIILNNKKYYKQECKKGEYDIFNLNNISYKNRINGK